ncbi:MAG: class I SAM-dependent methyltransferase [Acidobacteria bacterium]|nr:MAG: class I SAM-dependent methyltransferase [Acidobacteriota bacterium]REK10710.1 MAG: class I SAM-dependent methyltransferase [Acidobacteriota bacterium]
MYRELVAWYPLLDPVAEHEEEAECFAAALRGVLGPGNGSLLEIGAGAGNNAVFLKRHFACTLSDIAEPMLSLSRAQNPECEHVAGDMRKLRLDRTFDAVLIHDAITYMTSEADLRLAIDSAWRHTRPGGAALLAPDLYREGFEASSGLISGCDGELGLEAVEWTWDPDPSDTVYRVDFAFLLRRGVDVRAVHETHLEGLFPRRTWVEVAAGVGFETDWIERPIGGGETDHVLLCRRPR